VTRLTLALPGDPDTATGGYRYDRRLAGALAQRGWQVELLSLPAAFPRPAASDLAAAAAALAALPDGRLTLVDGLALGVMPGIAQRESRRLRLLALVHHPLALETGLAAGEARRLADSERRALAAAGRVITTSATTAGVLETAYGVDPARLWVAEPGTDPAPPAEGSGGPGIALLCVATLTPRKGHAPLIEALSRLAHLDWSLTCAGSDRRAPATALALREAASRAGLGTRVRFTGEVDESRLHALYHRADAFVLATRFEGYGMALAEALARGLPVLTTDDPAAARTAGEGAALRVPVDCVPALAGGLARLIADPALRARLARAARERAARLPTWPDTAARVEGALRDAQAR